MAPPGRGGPPDRREKEPDPHLGLPRPQILLAQRDAREEPEEAPVGRRRPDDRVHERRAREEAALDPERFRELSADLPPPPRLVGREEIGRASCRERV